MRRFLSNLLAVLSLLMCIGVLVLWVRSRTGTDHLDWSYDRYLADRSAASTQLYLNSERNRLWLTVTSGHVEPFNGQLVWGYYLRADQSSGKPQLKFSHENYNQMDSIFLRYYDPDSGTSGWGPVHWQCASRSRAKEGDDSRIIRIGISYWMVALILLIMPALRFKRSHQARRASRRGLCRRCAYDLRASVDRCPECGTIP